MLLQLSIDMPEHLALIAQMHDVADIIEIGTPVLKRFGLSAITTARELCPQTLILADTKTVDGGDLEAQMVFGAGAAFMTVLSVASPETITAVGERADAYGATVILDTITQSGQQNLLPPDLKLPNSYGYIALHLPQDARLAEERATAHIEVVRAMHDLGYRVSLAGEVGLDMLDAVIEVEPEILVVGSAITGATNAREVAQLIKNKLPNPHRGWPWDKRLMPA